MNLEAYKNIIKDEVRSVEVAGKIHYYRVPGYLDIDLFSIMKDEKLKNNEKEIHILAALICDEDGHRVFDSNNEEHMQIISSFPNSLITPLITAVHESFFPGESKAQD
jgi:hypothetical protein